MIQICRSRRVEPSDERLLAIYRSEPTPRLLALRRALQTERRETPDVVTWCDRRLGLVERVLTERPDAPRR